MKDGYIKVAAATVDVKVADVEYNTLSIKKAIDAAENEKIKLLVMPELCVTGYTCGDLFLSFKLREASDKAITEIADYTKTKDVLVIFGAPYFYNHQLYNTAIVVGNGNIYGIVPKTYLPNHGEFCEIRYFSSYDGENVKVDLNGKQALFGRNIIFAHKELKNYIFGAEVCEDLWSAYSPSINLAYSGANIIANVSASSQSVGKSKYRRDLVSVASAKLICGYIFANASSGESTQDTVFSSHHIIAENGTIVAENKPFEENNLTITEIDVNKLSEERHRNSCFDTLNSAEVVYFDQIVEDTFLSLDIEKNPFVPSDNEELLKRAEEIINIQVYGLKKRLEHTNAKTIVLGVSGGLDSTLALLVCVKALDLLKRPRTDIKAVTMPCFGTTDRTKTNAEKMCEYLGTDFITVNIEKSVRQHFEDIGQQENNYDVTYENSQARERTQVLMDIANKTGGLVIGTGDLSELALGWATYNGDHMSMYGVNSSVPKTLIRHIIKIEAQKCDDNLKKVLLDVVDTPVSPELLPAKDDGDIAQKTEDIVGPYELHDFFLYYTVRLGFAPKKIFRLCRYAYKNIYDDKTIVKWLKTFTRRFFNQQFKRSCLPDGPKVGSVCLSPRGDFKMPSDAVSRLWLDEIEEIENGLK